MNARISKQAGRKLAGSPEARRRAQVVLEVLAGSLTPHQGAESLGISAPKYYVVESRALDGLIAGCEPRRKGRTEAPERELDRLRREQEVEDLRMKLEVAYVREEIMLGMPQVFEPLKKKLRRLQDKQAIIDRDDAPVPGGEDAGGADGAQAGGDPGAGARSPRVGSRADVRGAGGVPRGAAWLGAALAL